MSRYWLRLFCWTLPVVLVVQVACVTIMEMVHAPAWIEMLVCWWVAIVLCMAQLERWENGRN